MTRIELAADIMAWLHRIAFRSPVAEFDAVGAFIQLCEEDLNRRLRTREMIVRVTQPVEGQYTTLPCDWLEHFDVRLQNGPELQYQPRADLANIHWGHYRQIPGDPAWSGYAVPSVPWNSGQPSFFSIVGAQMELMPFPENLTQASIVPNLELAYYRQLTLGPNDTDTTPVLSLRPSLYLYGSLVQSAPFVRDDERLRTWGTFYEGAIQLANAESEKAKTQGSRLIQRYRRLA